MTAAPDLTAPVAQEVGCSGTSIDGTCVATFFAPMLKCFHASGACQRSTGPGSATNLCFASGSKVFGIPSLGTTSEIGWMGSNSQCFMKSIVILDGAGVAHFQYIEDPVPGQLDYDEHTGNATCPDGTVVHVGTMDGCGALGILVAPWRTAMCVDGTCN